MSSRAKAAKHSALVLTAALAWSTMTCAENVESVVETATNVLLGQSHEMSFSQALDAIRDAAANGDVGAARVYAVIWLAHPPSDPAHKTSKINAYFGVRNLLKLSPTDAIPLPDPMELKERFASLFPDYFEYVEETDVMTDARSCSLVSARHNGLRLGFDSRGAYVEANTVLDYEAYERVGVRIDDNKVFPGLEPEALREREKEKSALAYGFAHGLVTVDELTRLGRASASKVVPPHRIYVALVGTPRMELLLRQLALGSAATIRTKPLTGSERIGKVRLALAESPEARDLKGRLGVDFLSMFDIYGYLYTTCVYGAL